MPVPPTKHTHRGVNKTVRVGPRPYERRWSVEEATILYAASPPPDQQDYDQNRAWVRDLADLLDRSPASISMHLGNLASAGDPTKGLPKVGAVFKKVVERYRNDRAGLIAQAKRLRHELFGIDTSPRVEIELTSAEDERARQELLRRFPEARLPPGSVIIYQYEGSLVRGVLVLVQTAILYPEGTAAALRLALEVLGAATHRNRAADSALDSRTLELAEREIARRAPKFDYSELTPKDRISMALLLPTLKSLKRWKPRAGRIDLFDDGELASARERISKSFRIGTEMLCRKCVEMLLDALEDAVARGVIGRA